MCEDIIQQLQVHLQQKSISLCDTDKYDTTSPEVHQRGAFASCYLICVFIAGRQISKVIQKPFIQLDLHILQSIYSVFICCQTLVLVAYIFL